MPSSDLPRLHGRQRLGVLCSHRKAAGQLSGTSLCIVSLPLSICIHIFIPLTASLLLLLHSLLAHPHMRSQKLGAGGQQLIVARHHRDKTQEAMMSCFINVARQGLCFLSRCAASHQLSAPPSHCGLWAHVEVATLWCWVRKHSSGEMLQARAWQSSPPPDWDSVTLKISLK